MAVSDTRRRILDTARDLFNAHGLHRVGVRDIARALEISPGNLAYHFATKDELVTELVRELHELNAASVFAELPQGFSLYTLYETAAAAMRNMLQYRFQLLSYFDVVSTSPELKRLEAELWGERRRRFDVMLGLLAENGFIERRRLGARADLLYEQGQIISSGWLLAETLRKAPRSDEAAVLHYAKVGCALLEPYCTAKGMRQMQQILRGGCDER